MFNAKAPLYAKSRVKAYTYLPSGGGSVDATITPDDTHTLYGLHAIGYSDQETRLLIINDLGGGDEEEVIRIKICGSFHLEMHGDVVGLRNKTMTARVLSVADEGAVTLIAATYGSTVC